MPVTLTMIELFSSFSKWDLGMYCQSSGAGGDGLDLGEVSVSGGEQRRQWDGSEGPYDL